MPKVAGGGFYQDSASAQYPVKVGNSIIAGNFGPATSPDLILAFTSLGHNLIGKKDGSTGFTQGTLGDIVGTNSAPVDPLLDALFSNGGPTQTCALLPGSPALNAGGDLTTLTESINASTVILKVPDVSLIPTGANIPIRVEDEQMIVLGKDDFDKTLTVTRGANGTTAATHASGTILNPAFDQRGTGFPRLLNGTVDIGAFESTLSGCVAPAISLQPSNQTLCVGAPATFSVTATGTGLSYQWRKGGVAISGATASSFTIPSVVAGDAANYDVVVTGTCGTVTSSLVSLTVYASTAITAQPTNQVACVGSPAAFSVTATGTGLSYQWRRGGTPISGATSSSYSLAGVSTGDAASYDVVVSGACGNVTSNAASLTVNATTAITAQPTNQPSCVSTPATFSVTATGVGLSYQWRKGGVPISGATASSFTVPSTVVGDAGSYDVVVTGTCGTQTSNAATLTVNAATAITTQPTNQTVCASSPVTFSVTATGVGLSYQWRKSGTPINGAINSSLSIAAATAGDAAPYDVVITGTCGSVTSNAATPDGQLPGDHHRAAQQSNGLCWQRGDFLRHGGDRHGAELSMAQRRHADQRRDRQQLHTGLGRGWRRGQL